MKSQSISGISTTSYQQNLLFVNNSQVGSWATIDNSTQEITVSNVPGQFAGQNLTIYANVSSPEADGDMLTPILIQVINQPPYVNTSYTELDNLTGLVSPNNVHIIDITDLFIDPENQSMTYSIKNSKGKYECDIIAYRQQCPIMDWFELTRS